MNNTASIAQFLAVLGGSANPALLQGTGQTAGQSVPDFRSLFMTQFGGVAPTQGTAATSEQTNIALSEDVLSGAVSPEINALQTQIPQVAGQPDMMNIWQLVNQNVSGENLQNAIVVQLKQQGVAPEVIDQLVAAVDQSDLVTIIKDPKLAAQLQNIVTESGSNNEIQLPKLADIIETLKNANSESGDFIMVNVAEMDIEEFKEWKKDNFSDLAAFFIRPKTTVGANGEIIKTLQGPAFLRDETSTDVAPIIVDIIPPQAPLTPVEFSLQMTSTVPAQQSALTALPQSFASLPLNNLGSLPPEIKAALEAGKEMIGKNTGQIATAAKGGASFSQAVANASSVPSQANNNTILTPFTTPADFMFAGIDGAENFDGLVPFEAGFKTASQSSNPLMAQPSASQPHPTTQMVAISLTKMASGKGNASDTQKYRLQLDPPEMGRVDVELEFDAGQKVRAMIVVEKPETLGLLQRDSHALLKALQEAGFEGVGQDSLNFDLSQGQNDSADHGGDNADDRQSGQNALLSSDGESELLVLETEMNLVIDPRTGLKHINMVV